MYNEPIQIRNEVNNIIKPDKANLAHKIYSLLCNVSKPICRDDIASMIGENPVSVKARVTEMMNGLYPGLELESAGRSYYINDKGKRIPVRFIYTIINQKPNQNDHASSWR